MPKWLRTLLVPLAVLALVAAACGDDTAPPSGDGSRGAGVQRRPQGRGRARRRRDRGQVVQRRGERRSPGGDRRGARLRGEHRTRSSRTPTGSNRDENVLALADDGNDLIIAVGFAFSPGINENAGDYPDQQFAIIDGFAHVRNRVRLDERRPHERDGPDVQGARGFLPRGSGRGDEGRRRWPDTVGFLGGADRPADREVPGRLRRRVSHQVDDEHQRPRRSTSATT